MYIFYFILLLPNKLQPQRSQFTIGVTLNKNTTDRESVLHLIKNTTNNNTNNIIMGNIQKTEEN